MSTLNAGRIAAGVVAILAWTAEVLFIRGQVGSGMSLPAALLRTSSYLTDWATLIVALVCTLVAAKGASSVSAFWRAAATAMTATVGGMFAGIGGLEVILEQGVSSLLAHLVIPIAMIAAWLLLPHGKLRWLHVPGVSLIVIAYLAMVLIRGALGGAYPYPFVDVTKVGMTGALTFGALVVVVIALITLALVAIDRRMGRRAPR